MKEITWHYSDGEIRTLYRNAADKQAEIGIIAELCARTKEEVIEKLRSLGEDVNTGKKKQRRGQTWNPNVWAKILPETVERARRLAAAGLYKAQIARALGIGESRCERMLEKEGIRCRTRWDWPEEKISKMIELREAGYPITRIAKILHSSFEMVKKKLADFDRKEDL